MHRTRPQPTRLRGLACCLLGVFLSADPASAAEPTTRDIEYAKVGEHSLTLDLYLPSTVEVSAEKLPSLIVWVHGGAWRAGSKEKMPIGGMLEHGYAIASINYRLSPVAKFPAQVHDIKAAIRFLRGQSTSGGERQRVDRQQATDSNKHPWRYDKEKIVIAGASAGGHLAALVGVTNGHEELEGSVGDFDSESSHVSAIVDFYGPTNFLTILKQSTPHGLGVRVPALQLLLDAQPEDVPDLAKLASPVFHVDDNDPSLLMIHGDQDPQVPINQSHELEGAYQRSGSGERVQFEVIHGGQHGGEEFYDADRIKLVTEFLTRVLK